MALRKTHRISLLLTLQLLIASLCTSCGVGHPSLPASSQQVDSLPSIYPDYVGVTIPVNIAPLNFAVSGDCESCVAALSVHGHTLTYGGADVRIDQDEWRDLITEAAGDSIRVSLYVQREGRWESYRPFAIYVSADTVDRYVAYRLIPPSYTMYEQLSIRQRDLTSFDEKVLYANTEVDAGSTTNHCINCHAFQNYRTERWQFHVRESHGGTVIVDGGEVSRQDLKRPYTLGAGVYPAWHPTLNLLAYSTNHTMQHFHTADRRKVEVQDSRSDLILYDVQRDSVITLGETPMQLEIFPTWSPDGQWLYYGMAALADNASLSEPEYQRLYHDDDAAQDYVRTHYRDIRYDIYRRSFDTITYALGEPECVLHVSQDSISLTVPRISPDGRYLLTTIGPYGCFHIWHPEADLCIVDLSATDSLLFTTQQIVRLDSANSPAAESFHDWSSTGRWIVFTSRRDDGNYTRLYLTHIDSAGHCTKALMLPQENPLYEHYSTLSYNVPEFTIESVRTPLRRLADVIAQ